MKITFTSLEYQNFMSVGNVPIKIELNKHKTTLISGENGSGKTTVLSALCFALFGRAYGSINKPGLVNSINQKKCLVSVNFTIGSKEYRVVRGIKPAVFEIYENGTLKNQDPDVRDYQKVLEQQILKFNYRAFTQVVMVGGGDTYTPFMRLSARDRREFVEDLLDIRIFSIMNIAVKESMKTVKDNLKEIELSLKSQKEKISLQNSFIKKLQSDRSASSDKLLETIQGLHTKIDELQARIEEKLNESEELKPLISEHEVLSDKQYAAKTKIRQLKQEIEKKTDKKEFHHGLDHCPTCMQEVGETHKAKIIESFDSEINVLQSELDALVAEEAKLSARITELNVVVDTAAKLQSDIQTLNREVYANNVAVNSANKQISELNGDNSNIETENEKLKKFAEEYLEFDKRKSRMLVAQEYYDYIQQILADSGIKSKIIKQYIPTINKLINKYLSDLDFFVSFHLDESFDETIKSRHRDTFKYDNFSDGQKRRIDLAILLTWMEIAKAKNALHTNVAFFDEIDAPLDSAGADMLHAALKSCSSENVFIISHKGDVLADRADNVIKFRIHNNFTEIVVD